MKTKFLVLLMALFLATPIFAFSIQPETDIFSVENIVLVVSPFVIYVLTLGLNKLIPLIPKWLIPIAIVPALSTAYAWVSDLTIDPDSSWWIRFGIGMLGIVIHEIQKAVSNARRG